MIEFHDEALKKPSAAQKRGKLKALYKSCIYLHHPVCLDVQIQAVEIDRCIDPRNYSSNGLLYAGPDIYPYTFADLRMKQAERRARIYDCCEAWAWSCVFF